MDIENVPFVSPVENDSNKSITGMSTFTAVIFVIGAMVGSGVLVLPHAVADAGWTGVLLIVVCCANSGYCGIILARCWIILEERWKEYQNKVRIPYPLIGFRAWGRFMRAAVSLCLNSTLFGVATVFLLLASQLVQSVGDQFNISFCYWILIFGTILCPLMWLGTPNEFWPVAVGALGTTTCACFLLFVNILMDNHNVEDVITFPTPTVKSFSLSFATILFAISGSSTLPTIQNDMKDRSKFSMVVAIGFFALLVLYLPVAVAGYAVYGGQVRNNVILSLSSGPIRTTIEIMLAGHFLFCFLIVINPTCQELEEMLCVPHVFNWKRCLSRTTVMVVVVFVAETVPHFEKILNLFGGSTTTILTFVFPPLFYLKLSYQKQSDWPERTVPLYQKIYFILVITTGLVGGAISTFSAVQDIFSALVFSPPCYISNTA
ncbi:amino acid transporter AVT1J-like [Limulus polyphemus]|uniref:Amino acid transporter AVT1J-like n=1 Tax=Limulus polyphemus TaxID=6850 RepID=A0ABM1B8P0_LIMPO|nr:amino acid transporter AVT1J-like [Limulus polyphemus]